ncbi:hypothetical protein SAMN04488038_1264 [Solimonas aquatica]|uniref:Uncharacterized protein n=1 Tax=Solimonas aquatica TaxID=489703 RepID=A0A1H9MLC6_9GAMM|nr:hypothetical protein [Solimonas aquatica]SER24267.1 hypothetical protein SAMN04488038_1264 [Solimonas aquatica]
MKIMFWSILAAVLISTLASRTVIAADHPGMRIGDKTITLLPAAKCKRNPKDNAEFLSKYLNQYDFKEEWGLMAHHSQEEEDGSEEWKEFSPEIQKLYSEGLVEDGFKLFSGERSPIVWMDFDGDGRCDFAASVSGYGQHPIQRTFLYRGMPDGTFNLVMADYGRDDNVALIPFIPISVSGEKLPVVMQLAGGYEFFQWSPEDKAFRVCELPASGSFFSPATIRLPISRTVLAGGRLAELCKRLHDIGEWATSQISFNNEDSRSSWNSEALCREHAENVTHAKPGDSRFKKIYKECRWWFELK